MVLCTPNMDCGLTTRLVCVIEKYCYQELSFYCARLLRNIDVVLFFMKSREFGLVHCHAGVS